MINRRFRKAADMFYAVLRKAGYDPSQLRDRGRFSSGGGGGGGRPSAAGVTQSFSRAAPVATKKYSTWIADPEDEELELGPDGKLTNTPGAHMMTPAAAAEAGKKFFASEGRKSKAVVLLTDDSSDTVWLLKDGKWVVNQHKD